MPTWEEIFTSNNPAGGRMINVISGVAGSDASPYTADNPAGGRAINVNIVGGGVGAGVLQLQSNAPLDTTLRSVTDQAGTLSPLQLSTTQVAVVGELGGGLIFKDYDATQGGIWSKNVTPSSRNYALISDGETTYVNATAILRSSINDAVQTQLTTTGLYIGGAVSASARLHVKGDGTNPIARFENSAGTMQFNFTNAGALQMRSAANYIAASSGTTGMSFVSDGLSTNVVSFDFYAPTRSNTSGTSTFFNFDSTFAAAAGSANFRPLNIAYTINNSGAQSGTATGIFLNATETALNGMGHNLIDLQIGGSSALKYISRSIAGLPGNGSFELTGYGAAGNPYFALNRNSGSQWYVQITQNYADYNNSNGQHLFTGGTTPAMLLGGVTNAFPKIKRNGAAIDFRFADDSGYCNVNTGVLSIQNSVAAGVGVASTHKVTIVIGGTTYYLLASNV